MKHLTQIQKDALEEAVYLLESSGQSHLAQALTALVQNETPLTASERGNYESMLQTNEVLVRRLSAVSTTVAERKQAAMADAQACKDQDSEEFAVAAARMMEASIIDLTLNPAQKGGEHHG